MQLCSSDAGSGHEHEFQDKPRFPGALNSRYTEKMSFVDPDDGETIPVYRVMDRRGKVFDESHNLKVHGVNHSLIDPDHNFFQLAEKFF